MKSSLLRFAAALCLLLTAFDIYAQTGRGSIRGAVHTSDGEVAAAVGVKLDNISNVKYWGPWGEPQPPRNYAVNLIVKL
jgi:hypothetical protein